MSDEPKESWWTPDQIDIVEDRSRVWRYQLFSPSDSVVYAMPNGGSIARKKNEKDSPQEKKIISGGWNHEHCELCFQDIGNFDGAEPGGYVSNSAWICERCYKTYIVPREQKHGE